MVLMKKVYDITYDCLISCIILHRLYTIGTLVRAEYYFKYYVLWLHGTQ